MADQLSGIAIIICIALGSLTGILLFIFAKRQIMRFTLKSRSGPHVPIAFDAPKNLRLEIERRLSAVKNIRYHPQVLKDSHKEMFEDLDLEDTNIPKHLYRMKVVEDVRELYNEINSKNPKKLCHPPNEDISSYFTRLYKTGVLPCINVETLHKFLLAYEHARFEPKEFTHLEYSQFIELLKCIRMGIPRSVKADDATQSCPNLEGNSEKENKKPLLKRLSPSSSLNRKSKLSCETSV